MINYAKLVEEKGYNSLWVAEHFPFRDAFVPLSAIAPITEKIKLGTAVINIYTRNPVQIGMKLATLDEASNGRIVLGIGTGSSRLENAGISMKRPLTAIRECITILRSLFAGEYTTYRGHTFNVKNVKLDFCLFRKYIPIYVAAVQKKMLQLAGEIADGVILTAYSSQSYIRYAIQNLMIGAERSGRKLRDIDIVCNIACSISEDSKAVKKAIKPRIMRSLTKPMRGELMFQQDKEKLKQLALMREALQRGDIDGALKNFSDEMVEMVSIAGKPEECKKRLEEYRTSGVNLPNIVPVTKDAGAIIETFKN